MVGQILDHSHFLKRYINAVNFPVLPVAPALSHNPGLASKLFITLTEGCGYDKICTFASVPARKTDYQAYLRKALKILNDMLLLKNMPADFPAEKYSETDFQK